MSKTSAFIIRLQNCKGRLLLLLMLALAFTAEAQSRYPGADPRVKRYRISQEEREERELNKGKDPNEPRYHYALWNGMMVGVDLFDSAARLFGQEYGGVELSAEVNLHNRFLPIWEMGIGWANSTPDDLNFTYKGKAALYNRIGMNYNFTPNTQSPNFFHIGFRYGLSAFKYDITDIAFNNDYWQQSENGSILNQKSFAHWLEVVAGIRVKIVQNFYMGWSVRFKFLLSQEKNRLSNPWYIPGFGPESSSVGFSYSIYYRIPGAKKLYTPPDKKKKKK